jgi:hypothetical protein
MSNAAAVISIVLLAFFLAGVTVGIIAVIAVSARPAGTAARRAHPARSPGYAAMSPSGPDPDDDEPTNPRGSGGAAHRMRTRLGPMDAPSGRGTPPRIEDSVP